MHVRRASESLWHQILFQMAISISSVYNHMYETLDMHVIHAWSYTHGHTQSSTVLSGAQMLRPSLYTHKHIATQTYQSMVALSMLRWHV